MKDNIHELIEQQQKIIKDAEKEIEYLRNMCDHDESYHGLYSWRVGSIVPAVICCNCGKCLKFIES